MVQEITRADDPRLHPFTGLTDMQLRLARESEWGVFLAEGRLAIERALGAGWQPISALGPRAHAERLPMPAGVPVLTASEDLLRDVTGFHVHRGCLGLFARRPAPAAADLVTPSRRLLVLEDLVDHANVGAAFRSAAALGADAALLSPGCADPLYRRAIKVSMGATLTLPFARAREWPADLGIVREQGIEVWALTLSDDADDIDDVPAPDRLALALGTEGAGLSTSTVAMCHRSVRIPMGGGVDSLNVAAAAAVAMFATRSRLSSPQRVSAATDR